MVWLDTAAVNGGGQNNGQSVVIAANSGVESISLPDWLSASDAQFSRVGEDLVAIGPDGDQAILTDYFAATTPPILTDANGAILDGSVVARLAPLAPGQIAQANVAESEPIGEIDNATGAVIATRADGTRVSLRPGDPVYQGDMIETGPDGAVGIVFADETAFSMADNGRMVLDEMIYDPATSAGAFDLTIVQGVFSFVSGEVARANPDAMMVHTPVATIGIRGTQVGLDFADGQKLSVVNMAELNGFIGEIVVSNDFGVAILNQAGAFTVVGGLEAAPSAIAFLSDAQIVEFFSKVLSHLPLPTGNENTYGVESEDVLALLDDFTTAAGGEESIVGGSDGFIQVTSGTPPPFSPVPTTSSGDPFGGGGGGDGGLDLGGGFGTSDDPVPGAGPPIGTPVAGVFAPFDNVFIGTDGDDVFPSGGQDNSGSDFVFGGGGNDTLTGGDSDDVIYGGDGDDVVIGGTGNGDDFYFGGNPPAVFGLGTDGEDNDDLGDTLIYPSTSEGVIVNLNDLGEVLTLPSGSLLFAAGATATDLLPSGAQDPAANHIDLDALFQFEHVAGGSGGDILLGDEFDNQIWGEWEDATSFGDDILFGGSGDDVIIGRGGDDVIIAGASIDAPGSDGDDHYFGGDVIVTSDEGGGLSFASDGDSDKADNTISYQRTTNGVDVDLVAGEGRRADGVSEEDDEVGTDTLHDFKHVIGGDGNDTLRGNAENNQIEGGDGDDVIQGRGGNDELFGGAGDDTFLIDGDGGGVNEFYGGDGIDRILGSDGDDVIGIGGIFGGDASVEEIDGGGGLNTIEGSLGNETMDFSNTTLTGIAQIRGSTGNDIIVGSAGDDVIVGGGNNDRLSGGGGDDTFLVSGASDGFDRFFGGEGTDRVIGTDGDDRIGISGSFGVDDSIEEIDGGTGFNTIEGGSGNETMDFSKTILTDIDEIRGNGGNDVIVGSAGDDVIVGGANSDTLSGGGGDDVFIVRSGDGRDQVLDFQLGDSLQFEGLPESDLEISQDGDDAVIRFGEQGVTVTLANVDADDLGYSISSLPDGETLVVQLDVS